MRARWRVITVERNEVRSVGIVLLMNKLCQRALSQWLSDGCAPSAEVFQALGEAQRA